MRSTNQGFAIGERDEKRGGAAIIERAARSRFKPESGAADSSVEKLIATLIDLKHESMLEHGDYIFQLNDRHIYDNVLYALNSLGDIGLLPPRIHATCIDNRPIVSGSIRAWRELFASASLASAYFIGNMDSMYTEGFMDSGAEPDPRVRQIFYKDLIGREKLIHERMTVCWLINQNGQETERMKTACLIEWRHFFAQRALGKTSKPNPQTKDVAELLRDVLEIIRPEVFAL